MTLQNLSTAAGMPEWEDIPTLQWVTDPTEVTSLDWLAAEHGCEFVGVKRDDKIPFGDGGSKIRKLDFLLASEPYRSAEGWHGMGAIGSGNLVALGAAADSLGKTLHAHCFWEALSPGIQENLALTCDGPTRLRYYRNRVSLAVRNPFLFLRKRQGGLPIIPAGSTTPVAVLGMVRAGLELAEQIRAGELPAPDRVYVAYGSGGTCVGLAIGLGLAKIDTRIIAVSAVEPMLSSGLLLRYRIRRTLRYLEKVGISKGGVTPVPITMDRSELGAGYGHPTSSSLQACDLLGRNDIRLEAVYTGKALSSMLRDLDSGLTKTPLLWNTAKRPSEEVVGSWWERLPPPLRERLSCASKELGTEMLGRSLGDSSDSQT